MPRQSAVLLFQLYRCSDFAAFYPYVLGDIIIYMPTLALVNAVAFRQMRDPGREFAKIRLWGTVGWIVAGLKISFLFGWDAQQSVSRKRC